MKTFFTQNRLIIGILVFLLVMNVVAVGSILFYRNKARDILTNPPFPAQRLQRMHPEGRYMQKYLELDENQFQNFANARNRFHENARKLANEIREKRMKMFEELEQPEPDMEKIGNIAEEIGRLHKELNIETGNYYLDIREICNPVQREKLHRFFIHTFHESGPAPGHSHGRDYGHSKEKFRNFEAE
ncbi:MAG: periplasmic heavy metal sensor [Bacteroidales bacterium]|nr:periplasmic heavy metal sensor [Bacteroidales bacterium]